MSVAEVYTALPTVVHLHLSRTYADAAGDSFLSSAIVVALAASVAKDFPRSLANLEDKIRGIYANSSDTLPVAMGMLLQE